MSTTDQAIDLPEPLVTALKQAGKPVPTSLAELEQIADALHAPQPGQGHLSGDDLLADPDKALQVFRAAGGSDDQLVRWYRSGDAPVHLLRTGTQPEVLKAAFKTMVPALARQLCAEAGVDGVGPTLLAEQVVEARCDESYLRMLAGLELGQGMVTKAERLQKMADRCSTRMMKSLDQLHRLKRPSVNLRVTQAGNVNLGNQVVNQPADGATEEPDDREPSDGGPPR